MSTGTGRRRGPLPLLYQDDRLAAVAKPSGLLVHRSQQAGDRDTCLTRLRNQLGRFVWPVHRLDRGASGVLLFALDTEAARAAALAFAERRVRKSYLAVVRGYAPESGAVDHPLAVAGRPAAPATTRFERLAQVELPHAVGRYASARYSLVHVEPLTGREHQIRRHLRHVGHPLVGDVTWGDGRHNRFFRERFGLRRLLLHAWRLDVPHPADGRVLSIRAPLPAELFALCAELGWLAAVEAHTRAA